MKKNIFPLMVIVAISFAACKKADLLKEQAQTPVNYENTVKAIMDADLNKTELPVKYQDYIKTRMAEATNTGSVSIMEKCNYTVTQLGQGGYLIFNPVYYEMQVSSYHLYYPLFRPYWPAIGVILVNYIDPSGNNKTSTTIKMINRFSNADEIGTISAPLLKLQYGHQFHVQSWGITVCNVSYIQDIFGPYYTAPANPFSANGGYYFGWHF